MVRLCRWENGVYLHDQHIATRQVTVMDDVWVRTLTSSRIDCLKDQCLSQNLRHEHYRSGEWKDDVSHEIAIAEGSLRHVSVSEELTAARSRKLSLQAR